jgi:hypothetical protein
MLKLRKCDIIVTQIEHCFEEASCTLPFTLTEPQIFMVHKERFPSELVINVKYCCMLSKGKLKSGLFVVYRSNTFPNMKSACTLWNVLKNLGNAFTEVHKLVEIVQRTPGSTMELEHCFSTLKRVLTQWDKNVTILWLFRVSTKM